MHQRLSVVNNILHRRPPRYNVKAAINNASVGAIGLWIEIDGTIDSTRCFRRFQMKPKQCRRCCCQVKIWSDTNRTEDSKLIFYSKQSAACRSWSAMKWSSCIVLKKRKSSTRNKNKNGDKLECENKLVIIILNVAYTVVSQIILHRLLPLASRFVRKYQASFVDGRSTSDQIFTLQQILQKWPISKNINIY